MFTYRPLTVSTYKTTQAFQSISDHISVSFADDDGLVAVTGDANAPADDVLESIIYARLFAAAPQLLTALEIATTTLETVFKADPANIAAKVCIERNRKAIEKARKG